MFSIKTISLISIFSAMLISSLAFAGQYSEKGYIVSTKVNYQGSVCEIGLSASPTGDIFQLGSWSCNSTMGTSMLDIARQAHAIGSKVNVVFEGNGATSKPVYAITISDK